MKKLVAAAFVAALSLCLISGVGHAQQALRGVVVSTCGAQGYPLGTAVNPSYEPLTMLANGNLCTGASGGGYTGATATPAGTNGTSATPVQGVNGGVPVPISGSVGNTGFAAYGPDAAGNAPSKPPVLMGLLDSSGNVRQASPSNPLPAQLYGTLPAFAATPTFRLDQTTPGTTNRVSIDQTTNGTTNGVFVLGGSISSLIGYVPGAVESIGSGSYTQIRLDHAGQIKSSESGSSDPLVGITPTPTAAPATSQVGKASAGNLYSAYATAPTAPAAQQYLVIINATAAPTSGTAITPLDWAPFNSATAAGATATINYTPGPPDAYSTGIVALVSTSLTAYAPGTASMINLRTR